MLERAATPLSLPSLEIVALEAVLVCRFFGRKLESKGACMHGKGAISLEST
jgi:hypothetical protein